MKELLIRIAQYDGHEPDLLIELFGQVRPKNPSKVLFAQKQLEQLIELFLKHPDLALAFRAYLSRLTQQKNFKRLFTDSGILSNEGFFRETFRKISHKILPPVYHEKDISILVNRVFHKNSDYLWMSALPDMLWAQLFTQLGITETCRLESANPLLKQLLNSILVISQRVTAMGLEPEILEKLPELDQFESPFIIQNHEITRYVEQFTQPGFDRSTQNADYKHILVMLSQCEEYIQDIRRNRNKYGAGLNLTYLLLRLNQHISRIRTLLILVDVSDDEFAFEREVSFLKVIVRNENKKNSLIEHFQGNVEMLAFQITEHAGRTGEHYITSSRKEWWMMLSSAMGGGFIVGFLTIFKTLLYYLNLAPFGQAFVYSMNYSFGFIAIHLTHSTLATKQPAMTASKIASSLDVKGSREESLNNLTEIIARVSRSQFIAFVGNVMVAFPIGYGLAWIYFWIMGEHVADPDKAQHLIDEIHPWKSLSLFHAAIAGFYLFLAGLISGYYDNKNIYNKISVRLKFHRGLRRLLGKKRLERFANYIDQNLGSLAGNFFFGIFLGSTGMLGGILGLPIDIRHITFAAGNFGLALVSINHAITWESVAVTVVGIIGIGLFNFMVSFSLALFVAIRSRKVNFKESRKLLGKLNKKFWSKPTHFFYPPREVLIETPEKQKGPSS